MSFTEIILLGNVGRDPELRFTPTGTAVCDFSLATNRTWKDSDGIRQEQVTWFKVTVWGAQAETVNQYLSKGRQVLVVADRIEASAYLSRDGEARASLDVTARDVRFIGWRGDGAGASAAPQSEQESEIDEIPF